MNIGKSVCLRWREFLEMAQAWRVTLLLSICLLWYKLNLDKFILVEIRVRLCGWIFFFFWFFQEGWSLAELFQVRCVVAAPYVVPYRFVSFAISSVTVISLLYGFASLP